MTVSAQLLSLLPLASLFSLPDNEIELDVSFSQKVPVGGLPYRVTLESMHVLSSRRRTGTLRTETSNERCAKSSCTALGVMIGGGTSIRSHRMRRQGTGLEGEQVRSVYRVAEPSVVATVGPSCYQRLPRS